MRLTNIEARDLSDAWFQVISAIMDHGRKWTITQGSYVGQSRYELDYVTVHIKYPGTRPLIPEIPPGLGIPAPVSQDYIDQYLPYLLTTHKEEEELYTYGERLVPQMEKIIERYKKNGGGSNQECISISQPSDIDLEDPPCFPKDSYVVCENDIKPIQDVCIGDKVLTHTGRWRRVTEVHQRSFNGIGRVIKTRGSGRRIICTEEHPFIAVSTQQCPYDQRLTCRADCGKKTSCYEEKCPKEYKRYETDWIKANRLKSNDYLVTPTIVKKWDCPYTQEEMFLYGLYLAEGWPTKKDGICFAIGDSKKELLDKLIQSMQQIYQLEVHIDPNYQGCKKVVFYSRKLAEHIINTFGKGARTKKVPTSWLTYPTESLIALLEGWVAGDGHTKRNGTIELYTTSRKLKEFAVIALAQLGITPSITESTPKDSKIKGRVIKSNGPGWNISWKKGVYKQPIVDPSAVFTRISSNLPIQIVEDVYNLEVEDDESYICNGFAVHNCLRSIDMRIYTPESLKEGEEQLLHWFLYFRSWDAWNGFPANLAGLRLVQEYMAGEIGVEAGEMIASSKGLHIYDHAEEVARIRTANKL